MKKNVTIFFLLGLLSCCIAAFILWRAYSKYIGDPYDEFTRDADLAVPLLIQMDEDTLSQFAPPPQAHEKKHSYSNGAKPYPVYGNKLVINYRYMMSSKEDIIVHYKKLLTQYGWNNQGTGPETLGLYYIKDTACFDLSLDTKTYTIEIWHDFWKQEFSPKPVPDFPGTEMPLWDFLTFGESRVYTCP